MEKKKYVVYLRVSTLEQTREGYSMEMMLTRCKSYISLQDNSELIRVYRDDGVSGSLPPHKRPALNQLLNDLKTKKDFTALVVWRFDRLARSTRDMLNLDHLLNKAGVSLESVMERVDTSTPGGRAFFNVISSFAEYEAGACSQRTFSTMAAKVGVIFLGGKPPLGYKRFKKKLVIDQTSKEIVETIFKSYLKCRSLNKVAKILNAKSMPTSYGRSWSHGKIKRILLNGTYAGYTLWNRKNEKMKRWNPRDKWIVIPETHEALIDEKTFNRVQKMLRSERVGAYMLSTGS